MSIPLTPRSLAFAPVVQRLATRPCASRVCAVPGCDQSIAEAVGRSRRVVQRWKRDGLTVPMADEVATALGTHPAELWGIAAWNLAQELHEDALDLEELDA